jgi:hypothetical protein
MEFVDVYCTVCGRPIGMKDAPWWDHNDEGAFPYMHHATPDTHLLMEMIELR